MEEKALPSTEQSLKFMAWDIKKIKESMDVLREIGAELKALNKNFETIIQLSNYKLLPSQKEALPF